MKISFNNSLLLLFFSFYCYNFFKYFIVIIFIHFIVIILFVFYIYHFANTFVNLIFIVLNEDKFMFFSYLVDPL